MGKVFGGKPGAGIPNTDLRIERILLIGTVHCSSGRRMLHAVLQKVHDCLHGPVHIHEDRGLSCLRYLDHNAGFLKELLQIVGRQDKKCEDVCFLFLQRQCACINARQQKEGFFQMRQAVDLPGNLFQVF